MVRIRLTAHKCTLLGFVKEGTEMKKLYLLTLSAFLIAIMCGCCISHEWTEASCTAPTTCVKCGKTEGERLAHTPTTATCTRASQCTVCKTHLADALGHSIVPATETSPEHCTACDYMLPMSEPENGQVIISAKKCEGSITVTEESGLRPIYVALKDPNGDVVTSFYVRPGQEVTVQVPRKLLYVDFSTTLSTNSVSWYGPDYLFYKNTITFSPDEPYDFFNCSFGFSFDENLVELARNSR